MKRPDAPCLFCCARCVGCHSTCKPFKEYEKAQEEYRNYITEKKADENHLNEIEVMRHRRWNSK